MKKNSITNKITPCCGLPFSVIYWWVSNLTLDSESTRQFILSKISQNGIIAIDGWKVLINSGTLEADASLTKAEFLAWFDCGRQPNCEQLKVLIESFKISNWNPNDEIPKGWSVVDAYEVWDDNGMERILKYVKEWFGGDGIQPTLNVGLYYAKNGGFTSVKAEAIDFKSVSDLGEIEEIPLGYKNANYSTELSENYNYFDTRCLVEDKALFQGVNVVCNNAGDLKIDVIDMNKQIIYSETKTVVSGLSLLSFSDLSSVQAPFYVGITCVTAKIKTNHPPDGEGFSFWKPVANADFTALPYRLAYSINVFSGGLYKKFETLQIMVYSETTQLQNLINNNRKIGLADKIFEVENTIILPSGTTIDGVFGRTILKAKTGFIGDILKAENKEDIRLSNFVIEGNKTDYAYSMNGIDTGVGIINDIDEAIAGTYRNAENGIVLNSTESVILEGLIIRKLGGIGIKANHVGQNYTRGLKALKIFIKDCHTGLFGENEHEYSNYSELMVTLCQIGQYFESGNLMTANSIFTRCRIGILVNEGYNHAHGTSGLLEIKHHQLAGIAFNNITAGHYCPSLHLDYANIYIRNSKGIAINGHLGHVCGVVGIGNPVGKNWVDISTNIGVTDSTAGSNVLLTIKQ